MADEKTSLFGETSYSGNSASEGNNTYYDSNKSKDKRVMFAFVGVVTISVLISIILSIVQGAKTHSHGFIYFLLGISLIGFVAVELFLIRFIKSGDLHESKILFLYIVGGCAMLESIFTDILLYQ